MDYEKLSEMSLEELGSITKKCLSLIYGKLRDEENFGYDSKCCVMSLGREDYDVTACIIDDDGHNEGISYDAVYWL